MGSVMKMYKSFIINSFERYKRAVEEHRNLKLETLLDVAYMLQDLINSNSCLLPCDKRKAAYPVEHLGAGVSKSCAMSSNELLL